MSWCMTNGEGAFKAPCQRRVETQRKQIHGLRASSTLCLLELVAAIDLGLEERKCWGKQFVNIWKTIIFCFVLFFSISVCVHKKSRKKKGV